MKLTRLSAVLGALVLATSSVSELRAPKPVAARTGPQPSNVTPASIPTAAGPSPVELSPTTSVTAAGRGRPWINFRDGRELLASFVGDEEAAQALRDNRAEPLALAKADFDEDGVPDLVISYSIGGRGALSILRGNAAALDATAHRLIQPPFLSPALVISVDRPPEFLSAEDFDFDGHDDLAFAQEGNNWFSFIAGTGRLAFGEVARIPLTGSLAALAADPNRIVAAIDGPGHNRKLEVHGAGRDFLSSRATSISLPGTSDSVVFATVNSQAPSHLIAAAGSELILIPPPAPGAQGIQRISLGSVLRAGARVESIASTTFSDDGLEQISVLDSSGAIHVVSPANSTPGQGAVLVRSTTRAGWHASRLPLKAPGPKAKLLAARVSNASASNLLILDPSRLKIGYASTALARPGAHPEPGLDAQLEMDAQPVAALAMRLSPDAISDLIVIRKGRANPVFMPSSTNVTFTVLNTNDSGPESLRAAIDQANTTPGADLIDFNLGAGTPTISLLTPLPSITEAVTIDGATGGSTRIQIEGSAIAGPSDGLVLMAGGCAIRSLVINRFSGSGINIRQGAGSLVESCLLGIDPSGVSTLPNAVGGVLVSTGNNTIGGTAAGAENVISGNGTAGIILIGGAANNSVIHNFIGTHSFGGALPNDGPGVSLQIGATNNDIGGTAPGSQNVIAGNLQDGVRIAGNATSNNRVRGNDIGVRALVAIPNGAHGVSLVSSINNTIGGTSIAAQNVIGGNVGSGIALSGGATGNVIQGNDIGQHAAIPFPNGGNGVEITDLAFNTSIGGTAAGSSNLISFNQANGVGLGGGTGNSIVGNSLHSNGQLGIDLGLNGVTGIDTCDADAGPNNFQNPPQLTSASFAGPLNIQGTLNSLPGTTFRVDFYRNIDCDGSGSGEGFALIGSSVVTTGPSCTATLNVTLAAPVAVGDFITATATDPANNTSEFSQCVTVAAAPCIINCPPNQTAFTGPSQCTALANYPQPELIGTCGSVNCLPPPGTLLPVGVSTIVCTTGSGPGCSFTFQVIDNTPPALTCPADLKVGLPPEQQSVTVNYALPAATDNCSSVSVFCNPPPESTFQSGTTVVTCSATDEAGNTRACNFNVLVGDSEPPTITCPQNVSVNAPGGQCGAIPVSYPPPLVSDRSPGATAVCLPPSGSSFPVGATTVTCRATDAAGNQATCAFAVNVVGAGVAEFAPANLKFKPVNVNSSNRNKRVATAEFTLRNAGCGPLELTFARIQRLTDQSRLRDADDSKFFSIFRRAPDGSATGSNLLGQRVTIAPDSSAQPFIVRFEPSIPPVTSANTALLASEVLPNSFLSRLIFDGTTSTLTMRLKVKKGVRLIDPASPPGNPFVSFCKSGSEFVAQYHVYDSRTSDATSASYAFLDGNGRVIELIDRVDLAGSISQAGLVNGQSFTVTQSFTGADTHPDAVQLRVTVFGSSTSSTGTSGPLSTSCQTAQSSRPTTQSVMPSPLRLPGRSIATAIGSPPPSVQSGKPATESAKGKGRRLAAGEGSHRVPIRITGAIASEPGRRDAQGSIAWLNATR